MPIKTIFLDLDDVCNEFTMHALKHVGCPVDEFSFHDYDPAWGFDILMAANALHPTRTYTLSEFWNQFNHTIWASFPESVEFRSLLRCCETLVGKENICILTKPVISPGCLIGKLEWIHKHCPIWLHQQFLIGPPKYFCARPDALLIDDSDHNVETFRAYGGLALLVPRPWNSLHKFSANEKYLTKAFEVLFDLKWRAAGLR